MGCPDANLAARLRPMVFPERLAAGPEARQGPQTALSPGAAASDARVASGRRQVPFIAILKKMVRLGQKIATLVFIA